MRGALERVITVDEAAGRIRTAQAGGRRVVLCHGCFDLVHPGHVRHLQQAAALGDELIVSVTGDALVGKGPGRPLIPQELRAENLAALDCVSWVVIWSQPTASELLGQLRPDIYVKGREYEFNQDPRFLEERRIVEAHGGRVVFTSGDVIFSSTALMRSLDGMLPSTQSALNGLLRRHADDLSSIDAIIDRFRGRRVIVAGETVLDTYVMCDRPDVASEAPIMTLRPFERRSHDGGAAIIARHFAAMGARPTLLTPLALSGPGATESEALRLRLEVEGIDVVPLPVTGTMPEKQRYLVGTTKVMKLDLTAGIVMDAAGQARARRELLRSARHADGVVLVDFGMGFWSAGMLEAVARDVRPLTKYLAGDVSGRRSSLLTIVGADLLTPSEAELRDAMHDYTSGLNAVAWACMDRTNADSMIVTMGEDGCIAFSREPDQKVDETEWPKRLTAVPVPALTHLSIDPLGCGDALLAAAMLCRMVGAPLDFAALLGSVASAAQAQRLGNAVIGAADLRAGAARLLDAGPAYCGIPESVTPRTRLGAAISGERR